MIWDFLYIITRSGGGDRVDYRGFSIFKNKININSRIIQYYIYVYII